MFVCRYSPFNTWTCVCSTTESSRISWQKSTKQTIPWALEHRFRRLSSSYRNEVNIFEIIIIIYIQICTEALAEATSSPVKIYIYTSKRWILGESVWSKYLFVHLSVAFVQLNDDNLVDLLQRKRSFLFFSWVESAANLIQSLWDNEGSVGLSTWP